MLKVEGCPVVMIWTAWAHTPAEWQGVFDRLEKAGIKAFPIMSGSYQNGRGKEKECYDSLGRDRASDIDGVLRHCRPLSEFC